MSAYTMLIGGELVSGAQSMAVLNPATEETLAVCARASSEQLDAAVAAAKSAFPAWAATPIQERQRVLRAIADRMEENKDELARLLTQEQGKPLKAANNEVAGAIDKFRHFAACDLPVEIRSDTPERRIEIHRKPLGVVAAIIPWNFPLFLLAFKVPPALLAGNTLVVKPAATTPLTTLRFGALIADLVPPGVINIIADANDLGGALSAHPDVCKVSFTGSTATGRKVAEAAVADLKRISLELGGNDAGIVLDDVDPKAVGKKLFDAAFTNAGQVCIAMKRLYVHESIYDEVIDELVRHAEATIVGDGLEQGTQMGPLQNKKQYDRVNELIEEARSIATVIGGERPDHPGYFIRPAIVRDIPEGARLIEEEQFGPVLPVMKYSSEEEAIARANNTLYGLGASIWSADEGRAYRLADRLEAGTVWVNNHMNLQSQVPFGGTKQSGIGSELGPEGLHEFTQIRVINIARA